MKGGEKIVMNKSEWFCEICFMEILQNDEDTGGAIHVRVKSGEWFKKDVCGHCLKAYHFGRTAGIYQTIARLEREEV